MSDSQSQKTSAGELHRYLRNASIGGGIAASIALGVTAVVGLRSGEDKRILLEAMLPSVRFLCSSVMTATATILSVMLALLGFTSNSDKKLDGGFFGRVKAISLVDTIVFILATFLLIAISVPLNESDGLPSWWYDLFYYSALFGSCILGGSLITIMLMLYAAVSGIISLFDPSSDSDLNRAQESDDNEK